MGVVSPKLRASARGQRCCFEIPGICSRDPEQTVLCHIRDEGKGMGNKANDWSGAFGCLSCHTAIDLHWLSKEDELFYMLRGLQRTLDYWFANGVVIVPGEIKRQPKPSTKIMPRRSLVKVA